MIKQNRKTKKWILYTHDGSRVLGTHDTYEQALRQERAIQWSKHHRKNPLENCDKRFEYMKEAFDPNLSVLKRDLSENVALAVESAENMGEEVEPEMYLKFGLYPNDSPDPYDLGSALQYKIEYQTKIEEELWEIVNEMSSNYMFEHFITPYFGMKIIREITEPFYFVHFTNQDAADEIMLRGGLLGREEIVYSTKYGVRTELVDTGYLFAYALEADSVVNAVKEITSTIENSYEEHPYWLGQSMIIGIAEKGIEVFHLMDKQKQTIIPVDCVRLDSLVKKDNDSY